MSRCSLIESVGREKETEKKIKIGQRKDDVIMDKGITTEEHGLKMGWTKIKQLGEGSFGSVSLARSSPPDDDIANGLSLPPLIAVKSAPYSNSDSLEYEREILHTLRDCPDVIKCYGADASVDEEGEVLYNMFLEYAAGGSLLDRIFSGEPLGEDEIKKYTRSILRGLKYIHGKGIVHCDIKPDNILLVVDEHDNTVAKIGDLGLALEQEEKDDFLETRGTVPYLAPKSVLHGHYGFGVDVWALGCTVMEMLVRKPLKDINGMSFGRWRVPGGIPKDARDFLTKCLNHDPLLRWSADKLLKDHPFIRDADSDVEIRETNGSDASDKLRMPKMRVREDFSDDVSPAFVKQPKLDPQVHKSAALHTILEGVFALTTHHLLR